MTGLLGLALLAGCTGTPSPAPAGPAAAPAVVTPPAAGPYVALGDSYTSGLGIAPEAGTPAGCHRSTVNYPALVAEELKVTGFTDASCSSATTADLTAAQRVTGGSNPPQLDALSTGTRLVTVGIGGNDVGFLEVLSRCAMAGLTRTDCRSVFAAKDGTDEVTGRIATAGERVGAVLAETKRRAPAARVLVVGYPALLPVDPAGCTKAFGFSVAAGDLRYLVGKFEELNAELKRRAQAAGARFVDTVAAGRDMCAPVDTRWIEPPQPAPGLSPVHPNAAGQRGVAAAVLAELARP
ncbi:SGNH/GDSL hydrolase family protein [Kitasatospora sp. NPDC002040]|uniref:SGNH/GDSL hydrolase family protein n=1 Tax=Kitasatospora sp. NPDC002040 TaxID=3154661 RepID=UPI0033312233